MRTKILWDDEHTTIKQTNIRTTVIRHYSDVPNVITYLTNDIGNKLVDDMTKADNDPESVPSHYISRHVREIYPCTYNNMEA